MKTREAIYQEFISEKSIPVMGMASLTKDEVLQLMEAYHNQFEISDSDIDAAFPIKKDQTELWQIRQYCKQEGAKWYRSQLKTKGKS